MSEISDLLERFRRGPELLAVVMTGVFGEEEDFVTGPDKWSIRQIAAHLADGEVVIAHRFRQIIAEDRPTLIAYDQEAWARNLDYSRRKCKASLESFRRLRAENYELLKGVTEESYTRVGNHSEDGQLTLRQLLERGAAHTESHARQVQNIRDEYRKTRK
jgi:hypothetical protein